MSRANSDGMTNEAGIAYGELIRRYAALNPYNRQVVMREMEMLYDMQGSMKKPPRRVIRLYQNDMAASAGPGETLEAARGEEVYVYADPVTETADEIIRVNGNSMEPTYCDGDLVFVRHAASLQEGEIGIFVTGDTGYIKEYHRDGLYSHNPAYQPIIFSEGTEVRCIGRVIGKVSQDPRNGANSLPCARSARRPACSLPPRPPVISGGWLMKDCLSGQPRPTVTTL